MYHYVRKSDPNFPNFRYLHIDDFVKQVRYFKERFSVHTKKSFLESIDQKNIIPNSLVLTFDDGFIDHYKYVLPVLEDENVMGVFYVPTAPYTQNKVLDVHKIHYLIGRYDAKKLIKDLNDLIDNNMLEHVKDFKEVTYVYQKDDEAVLLFKKILNYFISYEYRHQVIEKLFEKYSDDSTVIDKFYLKPEQIKALAEAGHIVGSHSQNHYVFSKLNEDAQRKEIQESFSYLDELLGGFRIKTFCYPYGGFHSFNETTEKILDKEGVTFSFNVESRDITNSDLLNRPQALPRYDCNEFNFGQSTVG